MFSIRFSSAALSYLKKIKDKKLKNLYRKAIEDICDDYTIGTKKTGELDRKRTKRA